MMFRPFALSGLVAALLVTACGQSPNTTAPTGAETVASSARATTPAEKAVTQGLKYFPWNASVAELKVTPKGEDTYAFEARTRVKVPGASLWPRYELQSWQGTVDLDARMMKARFLNVTAGSPRNLLPEVTVKI
ncbi:MAG: hypothetical protein VKP72_08835 [bacterium]|nr:hypothetical protein [bacterium]